MRIFGLIIRIVMVSAGLAASPVCAQTQPDFRKLELEAIENSLKETEANRSRLKSEIDAIAMDRARRYWPLCSGWAGNRRRRFW